MWTVAQVKAADAALSPPLSDTNAAAAALNAQTTTLPPQDINTGDVERILVPTGEMFAINAFSQKTVSNPVSPTISDIQIMAAWNMVRILERFNVIQTSLDSVWQASQEQLGILEQAGLLSPSSAAAIAALRTPTVPLWDPPLTGNDIATARAS